MELLESIITLRVGDFLRSTWGTDPWVEIVIDLISVVVISTFCLLIVISVGKIARWFGTSVNFRARINPSSSSDIKRKF